MPASKSPLFPKISAALQRFFDRPTVVRFCDGKQVGVFLMGLSIAFLSVAGGILYVASGSPDWLLILLGCTIGGGLMGLAVVFDAIDRWAGSVSAVKS